MITFFHFGLLCETLEFTRSDIRNLGCVRKADGFIYQHDGDVLAHWVDYRTVLGNESFLDGFSDDGPFLISESSFCDCGVNAA